VQGKGEDQGAGNVTEVAGVPIMPALRARVRLSVLGSTADGDVFYLVSDTATVWTIRPSRYGDKYMFLAMEADVWRTIEHVGTGERGQRVVILHNTRKFSAVPAEPED
jgi:hypothetical protein